MNGTTDLRTWATQPFGSEAEMLDAMRDPRYSNVLRGGDYRAAVTEKIARMLEPQPTAEADPAGSPADVPPAPARQGAHTFQVTDADQIKKTDGKDGSVVYTMSAGARDEFAAARQLMSEMFGPQSVAGHDGSIGASVSYNGLPQDVRRTAEATADERA